jgi:DNA polymerase III delta subunit
MITLLVGENTFERDRAVAKLVAGFDGVAEQVDGSALEMRHIPDLLMGSTLFADKRLVIIKNLSENSVVWSEFYKWLPRISDDIALVLVETKVDKRTVTYKDLKKSATIQEFLAWSDRDESKAENWLVGEAKTLGFSLDKKSAHQLVERAGVDQWRLYHALEKLALLDDITAESIVDIVEPNLTENVFNLFETALMGNTTRIHGMIRTLELNEEPYKLFALLSSQAVQLAAIAAASPTDNPAKDFGIHPFVVSKLSRYAKQLGKSGTASVVTILADADIDMKSSRGEPWLLIERALATIAQG